MAWDIEGTKTKILTAALAEFAHNGPDGTTVAKIAARAGVNKERIYNYSATNANSSPTFSGKNSLR